MPSRRTHSKSRHGCRQCKISHVKCDLSHPSCGRCVKSKKVCNFTPSISSLPLEDESSPEILIAPGEPILVANNSCSDVQTLAWEDLELLHHFSTVTYYTLAYREDLHQMWRIQIPKMALKQKFLMHSLFSVASLHIASSHPENAVSYIDRAIRHNNIALREYSSKLHSITPEDSPSLFACSILLIIVALRLSASSPRQGSSGTIKEIAGIFILTRGVRALDDSIILPKDISVAVELLEEYNQHSADAVSEKKAYSLAIQGLKVSFMHLRSKERDNGIVLSWPVDVSQEYTKLLYLERPMALVILAYFAVTLDEVRESWWAEGWGTQLIFEVSQMLSADWKPLMAWPMDRISERTSRRNDS